MKGTPFQQKVWKALKSIPRGEVRTYAQVAVANACASNPYVPEVPCHRVVRSDGGLGGYSGTGGVEQKRLLLSEEGVDVSQLKAR
jgi:methylated-DNA-[protein]-cysteine S-methyltransferase